MATASIEQAKLPKNWKWDARKKFIAYRDAVNSDRSSPIYRELMHAYHQLSMGRTVLSVSRAMQAAGTRTNGEPVLAIANASAKWVWFHYRAGWRANSDGSDSYQVSAFESDHATTPGWAPGRKDRDTKHGTFRFPMEFFSPLVGSRAIRARVPLVPPDVRPRGRLDHYAILWEANWQEAPKDPYLLRRITGDLFVVLAQWDLTEIERIVLDMSTVGQFGM